MLKYLFRKRIETSTIKLLKRVALKRINHVFNTKDFNN